MPTDAAEPVFLFPDLARHSFHGLPGLLADALPDAFGNALIDAWMARHGVTADAATALDRLAYMGKRGVGALEFRPARGSHSESAERSEEHTSELQSLMRISYAVFCLKKKNNNNKRKRTTS